MNIEYTIDRKSLKDGTYKNAVKKAKDSSKKN